MRLLFLRSRLPEEGCRIRKAVEKRNKLWQIKEIIMKS